MIYNDVFFGTTAANLISINSNELHARLGKGFDLSCDAFDEYITKYNEKAIYRYSYVKLSYTEVGGMCNFEGVSVKSSALAKVLSDSKEVILLAVTSGIEVDRLIAKYTHQNPQFAFIIDAIASAGIESYADYITNEITRGINVTNRFSPGYADFPLYFQTYILERLSANKNIGIMLSKDLLMIPTKSITAVIGIK